MRKTIFIAALIFFIFSVVFTSSASATSSVKAIFTVGQSSYTVDGQVRQMDAKAFIENSRTYVPIRYLALALGVAEKDIIWQSPNVILKLNNIELKLSVGSNILFRNGQQINMDVSVINRNGRTYLPARWVAEAFGYEVEWQPPRVLIGHNLQEEIQSAPFQSQLTKLEMEVGSRKAIATPSMEALMSNSDPNIANQARKITQEQTDKILQKILQEQHLSRPYDALPERLKRIFQSNAKTEALRTEEVAAFLNKHKYAITLDAAPYLAVVSKENAEWYLEKAPGKEIYKKYPPVIDSGAKNGPMYLPFASVAKAFGVPDSNIKWNGNALRMHWNKNMWKEFRSDSNYAMWYKGGKDKLEAPARVKNGVMMINSTNTYWTVLPANPFIDDGKMHPLLYAMPETDDNGHETGKPYITCHFYDWLPLNEF